MGQVHEYGLVLVVDVQDKVIGGGNHYFFPLMFDDEKHILGQVVDIHNLAYRAQGLVNELIADEFKVFLNLLIIMLLFFGRETLAVEV